MLPISGPCLFGRNKSHTHYHRFRMCWRSRGIPICWVLPLSFFFLVHMPVNSARSALHICSCYHFASDCSCEIYHFLMEDDEIRLHIFVIVKLSFVHLWSPSEIKVNQMLSRPVNCQKPHVHYCPVFTCMYSTSSTSNQNWGWTVKALSVAVSVPLLEVECSRRGNIIVLQKCIDLWSS